MRAKTTSIVTIVLLTVTVRQAVAEESFGAAARSWAFYGGDAGGSRYSALNQIAAV
jgi:quinoprotein glucose dehydrogenase